MLLYKNSPPRLSGGRAGRGMAGRAGLFARLHLDAYLVLENLELLEAGGAPLGHAVLEDDQRGHAAYLVLGREVGIAVDINLDDVGGIAYLVLELLEDRALHLAGAAPCGEEIDESRFVGCDYVFEFAHSL